MNEETRGSEVPREVGPRVPLWAQIAIALALGLALGAFFRRDPIVGTIGVEELGRLGMIVIRALKTLAVPLVFLVIVDALLRFRVEGRKAWQLARICAANVSVAMVIGLVLVNVLQPGRFLRDLFLPVVTEAAEHPAEHPVTGGVEDATVIALDPIAGVESVVPSSVLGPFVRNEVLGAALLALLFGVALRHVRRVRGRASAPTFETLESLVLVASETTQTVLGWVVRLVPFAAFALVAHAVGKAGIAALGGLWAFLATILAGMTLHACVYYPLLGWLRGGVHPLRYFEGARDALVTGFATNSSLATLPVTLRCLTEKVGVSPESARIGAALGTNFNNDGITLYEAMAVLIIAQACGYDLGFAQQAAVVGAAIMAGAGIAGIPEAGLVMLPTVLAAAGLPDTVVAAAVPLVVPVDWLIARIRTLVNVLSDMLVSILLDRPTPVAATGVQHEAQL